VLIRASDGRVTRITNDVNDYPHATFSPATGTIVTLQRERLGSLWIGSADRPEDAKELPSRLGENDGRGGLAWLNNRQLVFVRETDVPSLWMVNDDGTNVRRLTENESSINPVASRDGNVVLFESDRAVRGVSEAYSLAVSDRRVTQITKESGAAGGTLSPDGRSVFFVASTSSPYKLLRMPFSGGPTATLFEGHLLHEPRMSPDGRWVAIMGSRSVNEPRSVMIVPADGGPPRTIYKSTAPHQHVQWYPSSDALLLMHNEGGQSNIFKLDIAGGPPRQLTRFTRGTLDSPAISPDGRRIAFYRGTDESDIVLLKPRATE
jgi:Tol biopolymer transport system component